MGKHYFALLSVLYIIYYTILTFATVLLFTLIIGTVQLLWIDLLEYYWNNVSEEKFVNEIHNIIIEVNPNIIIFENRSLLLNMQKIYERMNKFEQQRFDRLLYNNGLSERLCNYYRKNI